MTKGHQTDEDKRKKLLNDGINETGHEKNSEFTDGIQMRFIPEENSQTESYDAEDGNRHMWSRKIEYVLTTMGYCVGLGNVWRFPYVCIRNGGGAFLIPFFTCLVVCGMPLFFLEVSLGQFVSKGALHVWSICPLFKGLGIAMNVLSLVCSWYYCMILGWTLIYAANSFRSPLPWTQCGQDWNTKSCVQHAGGSVKEPLQNANSTDDLNTTLVYFGQNSTPTSFAYGLDSLSEKVSYSASEEFWMNNVLELSPGLEHLDGLPWKNVVALLVASTIVVTCIIKGPKTVGKVVYVTAILPYILLSVLIIKGATLDGAVDGILFYVKPDFSKLLKIETWVEASVQVFFSLGPGWGGLITMSSYNKFNNNCMRDAILLSFVCEGTSVFAGFAIFTVLGHMAHTLDVPVANFSSSGPGLAFVVYPEAISYLPVPQLWGVLFFIMLFTLGLDSQFTVVETCLTTIADHWPHIVRKWEILVKIIFSIILFLVSLPFATRGGMYLFQLADWYVAAFAVALNGILECVVVAWIYGAERLLDDIQLMIGRRPPYLFVVLWRFITPLILTIVLLSTLLTYGPPNYEGYTYGQNGEILGWIIATVPFLPIPSYAVYKLIVTKGTLIQRVKTACTPSSDWRPADVRLRDKYRITSENKSLCTFRLPCSRFS